MLQYIVVQNIATQCEVAGGASADCVELHCIALRCVASVLIVFYCIVLHCIALRCLAADCVGKSGSKWSLVQRRTSQCSRMQVSNQSMRVWDKITIILKSRNAIFSCLPQQRLRPVQLDNVFTTGSLFKDNIVFAI